MDGDVADVVALAALARRHDAALILDEAHAIGVWGPEGRGVAAEHGVVPDVLVGTGGKALGASGAFAATTPAVAQLLWNRARSLVFSTGGAPAVAASMEAAIEIVRGSEGQERRRCVERNARMLRARVAALGGEPASAIAPLLVGDDRVVMQLSRRLFDGGIFAQGIRPPTVPVGTARVRVSVSAGHSENDIATLAAALVDALRQR
jgi:7-keto-8-aminopelargonate synthetase-like enzyme